MRKLGRGGYVIAAASRLFFCPTNWNFIVLSYNTHKSVQYYAYK